MSEQSFTKTFKIRKTMRMQRTQQIQDQEEVANLQDLRIREGQTEDGRHPQIPQNSQQNTIQVKPYQNDEQDINCYRFPHSSFCGCDNNCLIESFDSIDIAPNLFYGNFTSGLKARSLLEMGITHILNVTSKEYTKRKQYFQYLNIDLHNNTEEDVKKFYRLTNRFIKSAIVKGGKVFIHASDVQLAAVVGMGYLIGVTKTPMKQSLQLVLKGKLQISPHFMKQIESYDLEKMAFVSLQRE